MVFTDNVHAIRIYKDKLGFKQTGTFCLLWSKSFLTPIPIRPRCC